MNRRTKAVTGAYTENRNRRLNMKNFEHYKRGYYMPPEKSVKWVEKELKPLGVAMGTKGLPGGLSGVDRFVRIAYLKSKFQVAEDLLSGVSQFLHMLNNVAMPRGAVISEGSDDITLYSSCMCQQKGIYFYSTYNNNGVSAVDMNKEDLDAKEIKRFDYIDTLTVKYQN